jgi:hypothetical protein
MSTIVKSVSFKADGVPQAGLSPSKTARNLNTGADLASSIAVADIGDGIYSVTYTYTSVVPCRAIINAGTDAIDNRYIDVEFTIAELNAAASAIQTADNNVILANGSKGLAKVYDDMAKDSTVSKPGTPQAITAPADMALNSTVAKEATLTQTVDGTLTIFTSMKKLIARLCGKSSRTAGAITYRNQADNANEITLTYTDTTRTPS